jgi:hypothetical protein
VFDKSGWLGAHYGTHMSECLQLLHVFPHVDHVTHISRNISSQVCCGLDCRLFLLRRLVQVMEPKTK